MVIHMLSFGYGHAPPSRPTWLSTCGRCSTTRSTTRR
jgi:hypothetical protein